MDDLLKALFVGAIVTPLAFAVVVGMSQAIPSGGGGGGGSTPPATAFPSKYYPYPPLGRSIIMD